MSTLTVNISMPKKLLNEADRVAKMESRTRSELIRESLRAYIEERSRWTRIFELGEETAKRLGIKNEDDVDRIIHEYRRETRREK